MNNLNSVLIEGNLVKDAVLKTTSKGTSVCTLLLVSNRFKKTETGYENEVLFIEVTTWARLAEVCYKKGKKGRGIRVVGRISHNRWTDTQGKPQSKHYITAEHVEFRPEFKKNSTKAKKNKEFVEALENDPFVEDLGSDLSVDD